jgi:hypothetical protein
MKECFTRLERKELRRLATLAYERELAKALEVVEKDFKRWRENKITALSLVISFINFIMGLRGICGVFIQMDTMS